MAVPKWVSVFVIVLIVGGTVLPLLRLYGPKSSSGSESSVGGMNGMSAALPEFAKQNAKTTKAYELASTTRGNDFMFLTCHCGCGMHAMIHRGKTIPKMNNLRDCFVRSDGTWEDHAAIDCPYCVDLAVLADDLFNRGYTLKQVRDVIDTKYDQLPPASRAMDMNPPMPSA